MKSILKKSAVFVAAAVFIVSLYFIAGALIYANRQYNEINTENMEEAVSALQRFTPSDVFTDKDAAAEWISHIDISGPYRITLISRSGQVVFDTEADSAVMENHLNRIEFQTAIREGIGADRRRSATMGHDYLYAAASLYDSAGEFTGVLRLSRLIPGFFTRLLGAILPFLIFGFLLILGTCIGLFHFSRYQSILVEAKLNAELDKKTTELHEKADEAESESRHREVILNSMFDGVITLDSSLNIIHANPRLCSLFGIDREKDVRGISLLEFSHSAELEEAAQMVLSTSRPYEFTLKRYTSGLQQCFQVFAAPLDVSSLKTPPEEAVWPETDSGETIFYKKSQGLVMVLGDISRLVKLEQVRKDFAANVSHELRTPIQVIQGFAENILNYPSYDQKQIYHFAEIIRKNALSMDNLTNDLLTLVSLESTDVERPPLEDIALDSVITEAVDMVAFAAKNKNIAIDVSCPPKFNVQLYSSLFVQALVNLLDNGIKYSGKGSSIHLRAFQEAGQLVIEVKDNGIGIPAEHIDRIFERFYRVDRCRSREAGGTGLGLSIVRHIALLHRGKVEAESHAGEGSTFRLKLPL
ncbi:MAG: PAS domain-containing protein [Treponema sp.]|jgi:two-component system phosphate regulon sensor histidine kinase PhoR|nr:PAS domain-containing protein [Treponema sp.]